MSRLSLPYTAFANYSITETWECIECNEDQARPTLPLPITQSLKLRLIIRSMIHLFPTLPLPITQSLKHKKSP